MTAGPSDAKDPNLYMVGEHSFNTVNPKSGADYGGACQSCHKDLKDFNRPPTAPADYNGNGKVEGVQDEIKGLLNVLWTGLTDRASRKLTPVSRMPLYENADAKIQNAGQLSLCLRRDVGVGADGKPPPEAKAKPQRSTT